MKNLNKIMLILAIAWMVVIYIFSDKPDVQSQKMSGSVSYRLISMMNDGWGFDWDEAEKELRAGAIDYPIRKVAHMSECALLCLLAFGTLSFLKGKKRYFLPILWVFVYACTDEFHQLFVRGRAGKFTDVLIDTSGAILMMLLILAVLQIIKYNKKTVKRKR